MQECLNKWAELYVLTLANAKLGFNLPTRTASEVVIDQSGIEHLPSIPRRAIYMKGNFTVLVLL
ncbi:TPA: hypothetical protein QC116_006070 [Bacillus thuringiensis]|nr:hypothetical protein [Bacillus thuringiensis]HDR8186510.1 hypothetical protein [Bacillus thuringiensis]